MLLVSESISSGTKHRDFIFLIIFANRIKWRIYGMEKPN